LRLYFYADLENIRLIHSFIFDGDDKKEFIRGLGVSFGVPMREQVHNRHVRFSGEGEGLWSEPVQPATGRRVLMAPGSRANVFADQLAGKRLPNLRGVRRRRPETASRLGPYGAITNWCKASADGFGVQKRVNGESCWLDAAAGHRASGLVFAGDVSGGLSVWGCGTSGNRIRDRWKCATRTGPSAELRVWLWSPDAPAMDLRHYDLVNGVEHAHDLDSSYEDVQPGFSTPHGVARTSEMTLYPSAGVPSNEDTAHQAHWPSSRPSCADAATHPRRQSVRHLEPARPLHPRQSPLEDRLDAAFALYHKEVEQRHWYGFWNYGDVMHQHDGPRHMWRYDVGGFAWDNTELGTDMWLWYSFLRSGRADIFRMAEAMTRHTGEVDTYHLGRFAGLGSRHNVRHWGCGAKEARISQAAYRRFFYYLTTDERAAT
jgi:hypothetical protein